jgi:hypothetical protein
MASTTPLPRPASSIVIVERSHGTVSLRLKELWGGLSDSTRSVVPRAGIVAPVAEWIQGS